jgi:hypothetical protein
MNAPLRSTLLLMLTLAVGVLFGAVGGGALARLQRERVRDMRRPPGFVAHLEEVIQPRDGAQRDAIHPLLEAAAAANERIIRDANDRLRARMDSLRTALAPLLDAEQRQRLDRETRGLGPGFRPGPPPPRGGPPPEGPPPEGPPPPPGARPPPPQ